jgi:ribonuclease HII
VASRSNGRKLFIHDRKFGVRFVAGADEAGRGCLAGPLVAAAVLFDLSAITPRDVRALGRLNCSRGIDARGLHRTNLNALRESLTRVYRPGTQCLSDGFALGKDLPFVAKPIVDGDTKSAAIAAASIIAKVTRDRFMKRADTLHPGWEFSSHVGYSTPEHREAIRRQGVSPLHRMSFQSLAYQQLEIS